MAVAGVIAEYNVFHQGHAWQLAEIRRRLGADTPIVVCMSGNYVQRGDFALIPKHARAETALSGGADLVLELPTPWATATAERFAEGGTALLAGTGLVTHLFFGCECGDLAPLQRVADSLDRAWYHTNLRQFLDKGMTYAAARQTALCAPELAGDAAECLSSPNNALAVEYLRALGGLGCGIQPVALPRLGAGHDRPEIDAYLSASAIRSRILAKTAWQTFVPAGTAAIVNRELSAGRGPVTMSASEQAILARLRVMTEEAFIPYDCGGEGLYHRFYRAVRSAAGLDEILLTAKTKRYPLARLRRMLLHSYLDIRTPEKGKIPPYLRVLGASAAGRGLLARMRKTASLPVLTKPGSVKHLSNEARFLLELESRCTDLYTLAYPTIIPPGSEYLIHPVIWSNVSP